MTTSTAAPVTTRFSVRHLFFATTFAAVCLATAVQWGVWAAMASIILIGIGISLLRKQYRIAAGLFGFLLIVALFSLSTMGDAKPAVYRAQSIQQAREITQAILQYAAANGHFPPPYTTDIQGKPLHSWRVLILPYLGEHRLYDAIDLTKPWYHPDNLSLQSPMPDVYRSHLRQARSNSVDVTTPYVAILGEHTAWPRSGLRRIRDIIDDPSMTLAILESARHHVHWMSTADPGVEMIGPTNATGDTVLSFGPHNGGVVFSRCDGSVGFLGSDVDLDYLLGLITVDGGESLSEVP